MYSQKRRGVFAPSSSWWIGMSRDEMQRYLAQPQVRARQQRAPDLSTWIEVSSVVSVQSAFSLRERKYLSGIDTNDDEE